MSGSLLFYRFARALLVSLCRAYFRVSTTGGRLLPTAGAYVLAPVHRSNVDFLIAATLTRRRLRYMGKASLWDVPVLRWVITALGAFPVHRGSADREAMRRCVEVLDGGEPLVVFPEGTRRSGPVVEDLYEGAAYLAGRAQVPIVPVGIGGSEAAMPKGSKWLRPVKVRVVVGRPIGPPGSSAGSRVRRSDIRAVTDELRVSLQDLFDEARDGR